MDADSSRLSISQGESTMLNHHRYGTENRLSLNVSRLFELFEKKAIVPCGSVRVAT
jgi:hypothetical protein